MSGKKAIYNTCCYDKHKTIVLRLRLYLSDSAGGKRKECCLSHIVINIFYRLSCSHPPTEQLQQIKPGTAVRIPFSPQSHWIKTNQYIKTDK